VEATIAHAKTSKITNGPRKEDLARCLLAGAAVTVTLRTADGVMEAQLDKLHEEPNGIDFTLAGTVRLSQHHAAAFTGVYNTESRTGTLRFG
jgi:hypothetical protein